MVNPIPHFLRACLSALPFLVSHLAVAAGGAYFQQEVNTRIEVRLDDVRHQLLGYEEIEYTNRSDDTLRLLYLHLWPNAYRDNRTALAGQFNSQGSNELQRMKENDRGFIDSLDIRINGKDAAFTLLADTPDIGVVTLPEPLRPGQTLTLTTPFRVKLPSAFISRLGHQMQAYYITQWYPKPAVYDREGWHAFSYLNQGEFYGEYGKFSVSVTLPSNYVVAATGMLTDSAETAWLTTRASDTASADSNLGFPPSSETVKTLHFVADSVHDFAWFADKRFRVRKGEVHLASGRRVDTWVYFTGNEPSLWDSALARMDTILRMYSEQFGDYAWPQASAVDGLGVAGRDMEYPMVTLIGECGDPFTFDITLAHELGHFWFYGMIGNNERRHGWMDEGLANFCETEYVKARFGDHYRMPVYSMGTFGLAELATRYWKNDHRTAQDLVYRSGASLNIDQSPDLDAAAYSQLNYAADVYYKPALGFDYLRQVLGDSIFSRCMHAYFERWKFRHPQPDDMQDAFEEVAGTRMDWLFGSWLRGNGKADYALRRIRSGADSSYVLTAANAGSVAAPFFLSGYRNGQETVRLLQPGFSGDTTITLPCPGCDWIRIDAEEQLPEVCRLNNSRRTTGMFRHVKPVSLRLSGDVETGDRTPVYYLPAVGWNAFDGWMTGAAFYNLGLCEKKVEFAVMPLYGWKSGSLAGGGRMMVNLHPQSGSISRISLGPGIRHYSNPAARTDDEASLAYTRVSFDLAADIRQKDMRESRREWMTLRAIYTGTDEIRYPESTGRQRQTMRIERFFGTLDYTVTKARVFSPSEVNVSARLGENFYRLSAGFSKTFSYRCRGKGFAIRAFAGKTGKAFHKPDDGTLDYHLHMSGTRGRQDYLYDGVFFDRSYESYRQFESNDGGFKAPTNYGQGDWLVALNLKTVIHPQLPIWLYAGIGTYEHAGQTPAAESKWLTETGIELEVIPGIFSVYFPLGYSSEIKEEFKLKNYTFKERIRFEIHIDRLNPFRSLKDQMRYGVF